QKPFSVTVRTVFEDSHVPLHKWLYATHLLTASKKGISSHQLHRTLGVSYKTAWFISHRIREAMRPAALTPMGGAGQVIVDDATLAGNAEGAPKNLGKGPHWTWRNIVLTLVERGGSARSFHVDAATIQNMLPIIRMNIRRESDLMTDNTWAYR